MLRKVLIKRDFRRCWGLGDLLALLKRDTDFQHLYTMRNANYLIGWLPKEQIEFVRTMPEVACINDDYSTLVQAE